MLIIIKCISSYSKSIDEKYKLSKTDSNTSEDTSKCSLSSMNKLSYSAEMTDWLKYHRLHKYNQIVSSMTYQELINSTEDSLIQLGVTKGAARKLSKIIGKLHERKETLEAILNSIDNDVDLDIRKAMCDLEDVIRSPIFINESTDGTELIENIIICLTKVCSNLLLSPNTDSRKG